MKITKLQLQQIIREEIIDWQGKYNDDFKFKVGMLVKDINPDCPHQVSEGIVTKVTPDDVTYTVSNNGKNYKVGNILTKTKDQLTPLKLEESVNESGILYRAGVKKYGKEGMRKIQQAAGKRKSHAVIGAIKDKYEKDKKESVKLTEGNKFDDVYKDYGFEVEKKSGGLTYWAHYGSDISGHKNSYIRGELSGWTDGKKAAVGDDRGRESFSNPKAMAKWFEKNFKMKKESVNEADLGLTYKKGKTVKVVHKTSGKELIVIDKPNVRKEYEKIGFYVEGKVNEVSGVDVAKKVLKNKQMEKGIDLQTANLIVTIDKAYDKNPALQKKFRAIPLPKMKQLVMKYYG